MLFLDLPEPLTEQEEKNLLERINEESARRKLVEGNLRLVGYIANKFTTSKEDKEEFFSIGAIGLMKAINTFNKEKGIKLATYATRCIENEILMCLRASKKKKAEISLETPLNEDGEGKEKLLQDILEDENANFEEILEAREKFCKYLNKVLNQLRTKEKYCILKYASEKEQQKIAEELGISQSLVSRLIKKARVDLCKAKKCEGGMYNVRYKNEQYIVTINFSERENLIQRLGDQYNEIIRLEAKKEEIQLTFLQFDTDCYKLLADIVRAIEM